MPKQCQTCLVKRAFILRPKTGQHICQECFFTAFEEEIHFAITSNQVFKKGERVAIGASGGKDSTVLAYIMAYLNKKYDYGLDLYLLSIDEGIKGYRDDSLETVKQNAAQYNLPLKILSYKDIFGWTMDEVVQQIGMTNNCTYCGVFRRQALDRGAAQIKADKLVTGHNADDIAETVLLNIIRGDFFRLGKCVEISNQSATLGEDNCNNADDEDEGGYVPRVKPFKYTYEKEIVMYAYHKKLLYFSTECIYSPNAFRGHVRELIKDLERVRPSSIIDIIHSAEQIEINKTAHKPQRLKCNQCGCVSSNALCKTCILLNRLNAGKTKKKLELTQ